ncbi:hypothetical protein GQF42_31650 [Streptomyces broussonetiae]|uniref:Gliding motility protein n=1 Tax=Streptomyces broussonetiae TaxID=2686304 RepID=A0A6I6NF31_9ACTN|nr:hypothetical protein GQF42_31650 [Streptomyces broussonetiae]
MFSRSKATAEASAAEAQNGTEPEGAEAEATEPAAEEAAPAEAKGAAGDGREEVAARSDVGADDASEGSGIPKQQSAEEAADSAAGEGARR